MQNTEADSVTTIDWLHVVAAVIVSDGSLLLAQRPSNKHQGGKWEFPGGKVEAGEAVSDALARELQEELGIAIEPDNARPFIEVRHKYPDKHIFLDVWLVTAFTGEPVGNEGQKISWFQKAQLTELVFPAANTPILDKLLHSESGNTGLK